MADRRREVAVVLTGGDPPGPASVAGLPEERVVIAADSGLAHAADLGLAVDVAVGDFDSVDPEVLQEAEQAGVRIQRHPAAKDQTDIDLALEAAVASGARRAIVIGGGGGRIDHWIGNVSVLASPRYAGLEIEARGGAWRIYVVRGRVRFSGEPGEYVSLLAWNEPAHGIRTEGLRWALDGETLEPGSSRGISNELVGDTGVITVGRGLVIVMLPGERSPLAR